MAGNLYNTEDAYSGLASVAKPTVGVIPGAVFTETDTGRVSVWNGSQWVDPGVVEPILLANFRLLRLILDELRRIQ